MPPETLAPTHRVSRAQGLLTAAAGDNVLMLSIDSSVYCALDEIASDVWSRLAQPMTIAELCDAVCHDYRGERDQILADLLELLTALHAHGIIDVV
ncbi:PqqD family protein [Sphingomonas sp. R647]|uniref:PqqD family protein n=1 Tax=Sphingomonas sp. R647 TaxID=2875233 RepID=UPI001CD4F8E1|nr:PqqD family protein [Sphingomonas sp. R647]MCA1197807.1 PqqD family protein [Sphingomonas sp. R647]